MVQKKKPFRFRIPWFSAAPTPRPATESLPRHPKDGSKSPTRPDTTVLIQRSPSRPSGVAPAQSTSAQTQGAPRTEPQQQPPSPPPQTAKSSVTIEFPVTSRSESPSRSENETQVNSLPLSPSPSPSRTSQTQDYLLSPSPSRAGSQSSTASAFSSPLPTTQPASHPQSPPHLASETTKEVSKPMAKESTDPTTYQQEEKMASPPRTTKTQSSSLSPISSRTGSHSGASLVPSSPTQAASQPRSPSHFPTESIGEELKPTAERSTQLASSGSQQEKEKAVVSEPFSPESEPKMKSPLKSIARSQEHTQLGTSSQPERTSTPPIGMSGDEKGPSPTYTATVKTSPTTSKLEPDRPRRSSLSPSKTGSKLHQSEAAKEKGVQEPIEEGKGEDSMKERPVRQTTAELHKKATASGTKNKEPVTRAFRAEKKQQEARKTVGRKMMFAVSNPSEQDIKVVSSTDPVTRNISSVSPPKPLSSNVEKAPLQKGIRDDVSKFVHTLAIEHPTQPLDDDKPISVITLAGDNRGATMQVGSESMKQGSIHIHRAYKTDPEESPEVTSDEEENPKKGSDDLMGKDEVGKAYVNSNIQSINNSLMFHGSITERDPGVQLILPQKPTEPVRSPETRKAEFTVARAERLTYQPTVRRRCLRGLFLEPSDSDPDNPEKPIRHGCKFNCDNIM